MKKPSVVPCKVALLVIVFFLISDLSLAIEAPRIGTDGQGAHLDGSNSFETKSEPFFEGDSVNEMDYTPARKKTPIHN